MFQPVSFSFSVWNGVNNLILPSQAINETTAMHILSEVPDSSLLVDPPGVSCVLQCFHVSLLPIKKIICIELKRRGLCEPNFHFLKENIKQATTNCKLSFQKEILFKQAAEQHCLKCVSYKGLLHPSIQQNIGVIYEQWNQPNVTCRLCMVWTQTCHHKIVSSLSIERHNGWLSIK